MELLLRRSQTFEETLSNLLGADEIDLFNESPRILTCARATFLSLEHASTVRLSFGSGAFNSGAALLRLQHEALVRGAWLLYAATDVQVNKLASPLDFEAEQMAKNLPGATEMLKALDRGAPSGLVLPLREFQAASTRALNSFVHGGIHPLRRIADGFPTVLGAQIVRNSNGLMHMGYRLLASLSGSSDRMNQVTRIYREYQDCLPMA